MENLKSFDIFETTNEAEQSMTPMCLSENAKEMLKGVCEGHLCKEADDFDKDEDPEHTYEGYINECMNYLKECMGQPGYASSSNPNMG